MSPRVLVIQQNPSDDGFLDDATILGGLAHSSPGYRATEKSWVIERIQPDSFELSQCRRFDLVIPDDRFSTFCFDQTRFGNLLPELPVILVVDGQNRQAVEMTFGESTIDVIVRTADLEDRLSESLSRANMRHSVRQNDNELSCHARSSFRKPCCLLQFLIFQDWR